MVIKEKKIEVEISGRTVRISPQMLEDAERLGAVRIKKPVKNPPKELLLLSKLEVAQVVIPEVIPEVVPVVVPEVIPEIVKPAKRGRVKK